MIIYLYELDSPVYKDFAYTPCKRVFEVLIYWIDIESHSSRPEMILMIVRTSSELVFVFRRRDIYIFPIDWCENPKLDRAYCCDLASKT